MEKELYFRKKNKIKCIRKRKQKKDDDKEEERE